MRKPDQKGKKSFKLTPDYTIHGIARTERWSSSSQARVSFNYTLTSVSVKNSGIQRARFQSPLLWCCLSQINMCSSLNSTFLISKEESKFHQTQSILCNSVTCDFIPYIIIIILCYLLAFNCFCIFSICSNFSVQLFGTI